MSPEHFLRWWLLLLLWSGDVGWCCHSMLVGVGVAAAWWWVVLLHHHLLLVSLFIVVGVVIDCCWCCHHCCCYCSIVIIVAMTSLLWLLWCGGGSCCCHGVVVAVVTMVSARPGFASAALHGCLCSGISVVCFVAMVLFLLLWHWCGWLLLPWCLLSSSHGLVDNFLFRKLLSFH